jgi:hypothetical protein
MENFSPDFPRYGKFFPGFSTLWKNFFRIFHAMEKFCLDFPRHGKFLSKFSTLWKTFFHGVENPEKRGWRGAR